MNPGLSLSKRRPILIVEDEALIRVGLVVEFEVAGYRVHEAASAGEAIAFLQSGVDLSAVITDLRMPGRPDGLGLLSWLCEHRPNLTVIVATGYPVDFKREPQAVAAAAVVSKPYKASDIISVLERVVPPDR